jgi:hypothetical protein
MHVNLREEHDIEDYDGYYGSCCSIRVSTLVVDMESGANTLHDFEALFLCDVRLRQDYGEISFINLELGLMPCLEEDSIIVSLMLHGGLGASVDARVENIGFGLKLKDGHVDLEARARGVFPCTCVIQHG